MDGAQPPAGIEIYGFGTVKGRFGQCGIGRDSALVVLESKTPTCAVLLHLARTIAHFCDAAASRHGNGSVCVAFPVGTQILDGYAGHPCLGMEEVIWILTTAMGIMCQRRAYGLTQTGMADGHRFYRIREDALCPWELAESQAEGCVTFLNIGTFTPENIAQLVQLIFTPSLKIVRLAPNVHTFLGHITRTFTLCADVAMFLTEDPSDFARMAAFFGELRAMQPEKPIPFFVYHLRDIGERCPLPYHSREGLNMIHYTAVNIPPNVYPHRLLRLDFAVAAVDIQTESEPIPALVVDAPPDFEMAFATPPQGSE
jgi:hypothetical protein